MLSSQIMPYIEAHESAWALSTWKSEKSRLNKISGIIDRGPETLHRHLTENGMKPYTIKTTFIRVCALEIWVGSGSKYQTFMKKYANKFKHAYQKKELEITFDEASRKIESLEGSAKQLASFLLRSGLRISEVDHRVADRVIGKGGKSRKIFGHLELQLLPKQAAFRRSLAEVGLRPHDLRKLFATALANNGATAADLCKALGWSDIKTAMSYLQPKDDARLEAFISESTK